MASAPRAVKWTWTGEYVRDLEAAVERLQVRADTFQDVAKHWADKCRALEDELRERRGA